MHNIKIQRIAAYATTMRVLSTGAARCYYLAGGCSGLLQTQTEKTPISQGFFKKKKRFKKKKKAGNKPDSVSR